MVERTRGDEKMSQDTNQGAKAGATLQNTTTAEEEERKKERVKNLLKQFIPQLKTGCIKSYCFNQYCTKFYLGKFEPKSQIFNCLMYFFFYTLENERKEFGNDRELLTYALKTLTMSSDPEGIICSPEQTINRNDLRDQNLGKLQMNNTLL